MSFFPRRKRDKEAGFVISVEVVIFVTVVVIGLVVGVVAVRDAVVAEYGDVAEAFGAVDQGYSVEGITDEGTNASVAGYAWADTADNNDADLQGSAGDQQGIDFNVAPNTGE